MIFNKEDIANLISDNETLIFLSNSNFGTSSDKTKLINYTKKDIVNNLIFKASQDDSHKYQSLALKIVNASKKKAQDNIRPLANAKGLV
jgi:hypothetical protein